MAGSSASPRHCSYDGTDSQAGRAGRATHRRGCGRRRAVDGVPHAGAVVRGGSHDTGGACEPARSLTSTCRRCTRHAPPAQNATRGIRNSCRSCGGSRGSYRMTSGSRNPARTRRIRRADFGAASPLRVPVVDGAVRAEPQLSRYVTAWPRPLDVDAMAAASKHLLGLHDFASVCRQRPAPRPSAICSVWIGTATTIWSTAHVSADAFCWSMVRLGGCIVGGR